MAKHSKQSTGHSFLKTRKQQRKDKRLQKKIKRNQYYLNKNKTIEPKIDNSIAEKPSKTKNEKRIDINPRNSSKSSTLEKQLKQNQKEIKDFKKLEKQMKAERKRQLLEANEKEDRVIKSLEKKLRLDRRKTKSLPNSFVLDGLDYVLEVCDFEKYKESINLEKELNENVADFDKDLAVAAGIDMSKSVNEEPNSDEISDFDDITDASDSDNDDDSENEHFAGSSDSGDENCRISDNTENKTKIAKNFKKSQQESKKLNSKNKIDIPDRLKKLQELVSKESKNDADSDSDDASVENDSDEEQNENNDNKIHMQEDIYGRLRDKDGNIVESNKGKYIPPHLRGSSQNSDNSEVIQRLRKLMKGALNRLTENNMHSIAVQIEDIYMKYSRNDCNIVLLKLLKESIVAPVLSPERIVIEHALLVSILHANVGSEIGAFILQNLMEEFQKIFDEDTCVEDKKTDNIVLFLCHMYNFKIFHACLIYDLLNKFVEKFCEKEVELILLVLKNVGFSLRKDDPDSLKEFIFEVQKKSNESSLLRENTRVRFMLDTLSAVKNNNMMKIQNYDPSYIQHLRKLQKSAVRAGKYVSELKISLNDLLNAETKGRWWIFGSAWTGTIDKNQNKEATNEQKACSFDKNILNLARKHRMNTDTRRNIFCILMTAEDFIDAFEKLVKLGLSGQQYQEIINVLIHCLMKEKKYNPYYAFIAEQFCAVDRKYQLALQFSAWDKFKEINSFGNQQIANLAKFLTYLFVELKLPLSILKVLQFTEMTKPMVKLIRQILLSILLTDDETVVVEVFSRIAKSEKLFMLREGLQLFLHHFVMKNIEKNVTDDDSKRELLSKRVELAVDSMRRSTSDF